VCEQDPVFVKSSKSLKMREEKSFSKKKKAKSFGVCEKLKKKKKSRENGTNNYLGDTRVQGVHSHQVALQ
jgi:hypothetical protein